MLVPPMAQVLEEILHMAPARVQGQGINRRFVTLKSILYFFAYSGRSICVISVAYSGKFSLIRECCSLIRGFVSLIRGLFSLIRGGFAYSGPYSLIRGASLIRGSTGKTQSLEPIF